MSITSLIELSVTEDELLLDDDLSMEALELLAAMSLQSPNGSMLGKRAMSALAIQLGRTIEQLAPLLEELADREYIRHTHLPSIKPVARAEPRRWAVKTAPTESD